MPLNPSRRRLLALALLGLALEAAVPPWWAPGFALIFAPLWQPPAGAWLALPLVGVEWAFTLMLAGYWFIYAGPAQQQHEPYPGAGGH